jgi:hypothetical protein
MWYFSLGICKLDTKGLVVVAEKGFLEFSFISADSPHTRSCLENSEGIQKINFRCNA